MPVKKSGKDANNRFALTRREMVFATAAAFFPLHGASSETATRNAQPDAGIDTHPAVSIPATPSLGIGKDRALVLGGGGEYFIAWLLGFAHGLRSAGVSYELADLIVGTSAGAIVGSAAAAGRLGLLRDDIDLSGQFPKLLADLIPTSAANPSQVRAREVAEAARDGSVATIQSIGRGAMAASNPPVRNLQLMIDVLSLGRSWPNPRFHATTTDCYTGERLILSQSSNIPISHAVCASVSLPGVFGPTWIGDRLCMDGAMCSTSTHVDLIAGSNAELPNREFERRHSRRDANGVSYPVISGEVGLEFRHSRAKDRIVIEQCALDFFEPLELHCLAHIHRVSQLRLDL